MKFGIRIPPPQMGPIGDPDFVVRYSKLVEEMGFESIWTIDHAVMHAEYDSRYPYRQRAGRRSRRIRTCRIR